VTRIAIVGCGYIADSYFKTLSLYSELQLAGVFDRDPDRSARFSKYYSVPRYDSFDAVLSDQTVDLVVNLTNPRSHFEISKASLESGKHVYSEKPLAMSFSDAKFLVTLANQKGLQISSAPSRVLGETAQTLWKALREKVVGTVRVVYAEMDHGMTHRMRYKKWINESGTPWPYKDEFETGCTIEHAEYAVRLLTAFFGPVESVTAFSSCQVPDKETDVRLDTIAPDFSVACLKFGSGIVARLTCSILAETDRALKVFGDDGLVYTDDISKPRSPVYFRTRLTIRRRTILTPWRRTYRSVGPSNSLARARGKRLKREVDFCLGIAELAGALKERRPSRLSSTYCLHTTEVVLAIHNASDNASPYKLTTSFDPIDPMPWAQ
jgi:predicted dehydrogenase